MNHFDYMEEKPHGTPDFPLDYYYVDEHHPHYEMPFHWHRELELSYILQGSYTFYLNDSVITAHEGDVVFIDGGVVHGGRPDNSIYDCIVFNPYPLLPRLDVCRNYIGRLLDPNTHIQVLFPAGSHPICPATKELMDAAKAQSDGSELRFLSALYHWFLIVSETDAFSVTERSGPPDSQKMQVLKPVLEYMDLHYMHPIALKELAELADMSVSHFCRYFKALIHKSPIDYLIYYRVERACTLLASTELPLMEVAYQCGFNDISYFIQCFKKYRGVTPKQYQKQYQFGGLG